MAFSPLTGLVYLPVTETYMAYAAAESFEPGRGLGTSFTGHDAERKAIAEYADAHSKGWLSARDPVTQREVWRTPNEQKAAAGCWSPPATWCSRARSAPLSPPTVPTLARRSGKCRSSKCRSPRRSRTWPAASNTSRSTQAGAAGLAHVERSAYSQLFLSKPRLLVFKLGGTARLPPLPAASLQVPELLPPPPLTGTAAQVARGEALYAANCALCHGAAARGGVKDLRHMMPATHADFMAIVLEGKLAANGMAGFADLLSREEAEAVHHYLIARAHADWDGR
jgi:quinohemoprotein ethanol dehydrogenase